MAVHLIIHLRMTVSKGKIRISRGPERRNDCHIFQPPVDTKLPWPPPAPFIIQLDYTIAAYLQNKEKVFTIKHKHTHQLLFGQRARWCYAFVRIYHWLSLSLRELSHSMLSFLVKEKISLKLKEP